MSRLNRARPTKSPPMVSGGWPLIGHMAEFYRDHRALFARGYREHGNIFAMQLGPWRVAVLSGLELNELFYHRTGKELSAERAYSYLTAMMGTVGLTAPPDVYAAERHILQAPFKSRQLEKTAQVVHEEVRRWLATLGDAGELELVTEVRRLTQQVSAHALMGRAFRDRMAPRFWDCYQDLADGLDPILPPWLPLPKFIRRDRAKRLLRPMLAALIEERRRGHEQHDDMLQAIAMAKRADGTSLPLERAVSYVLALVFAGFDTTTGHASWALIHLLQHRDYLAEVVAEIDALFADDPRRDIDMGALRSLPLLKLALQETERIQPVADRHVRAAIADVDAGDFRIPRGWTVMTSGAITHLIPELYRDPLRYDPRRFTRGEGKHPMSLIGFGGGPHKCTGMRFAYLTMATWLAELLRHYDLELVTPHPRIASTAGVLWPEPTRIRYRRRGVAG